MTSSSVEIRTCLNQCDDIKDGGRVFLTETYPSYQSNSKSLHVAAKQLHQMQHILMNEK